MTRTREIEIYVSDLGLSLLRNGLNYGAHFNLECRFGEFSRFKHPIKIVVPEPERKIELTESALRDVYDSYKRLTEEERKLIYPFYEYTKQKLFGSEG